MLSRRERQYKRRRRESGGPFLHKGVREPHFSAIYGTIAGSLHHGEDIMKPRVDNDTVQHGLVSVLSAEPRWRTGRERGWYVGGC